MPKSIKLNSDLWQRVEQHAKQAGYSSAEEFVEHILERELARQENEQSEQEVERRLKGLGYLE
jgi:metal-responsive CopG/Arc/MetJ family transcriptional regulator